MAGSLFRSGAQAGGLLPVSTSDICMNVTIPLSEIKDEWFLFPKGQGISAINVGQVGQRNESGRSETMKAGDHKKKMVGTLQGFSVYASPKQRR